MNVLLDVNADRYWLQSAVACNIASTHEDLHAIASTTSRSALQGVNLC